MINKAAVMEYFEKEGYEEIDEIKYRENTLVYNLFYTFDEAEIEAAKDYANENYSEKNGEQQWYDEFFLPYLIEISTDNVKDVLSDMCEDLGLTAEFIVYDLDRESHDQCEFVIILGEEGSEIDVDKVLKDLDL